MLNINIFYICTGSDENSIIYLMKKPTEKAMEQTLKNQPQHTGLFRFSWSQLLLSGYQLLGKIQQYQEIAKQRQALRQLTDEQLEDIGISRADAIREANKPFWR